MTKVAEIERIRWAHFREGVSLRELARTFHHSRRTIGRALADPGPWSYRRERPVKEPVMGPGRRDRKALAGGGFGQAAQTAPHSQADLGQRVVAKFGVKPYRGEFADVIPHLTVAQENGTPELEAQLLPALPIDPRAVEAWLMVQPVAERGWIRHLRLPLTRT